MKKSQYIKQRRIQQRNLERVTCKNLVWHIIIITIIMIIALCNMPRVIAEKEDTSKVSESYSNKTTTPYVYNLTTFEPQTEEESSEVEVDYYPEFTYSKDWSAQESYLLARIAMAELKDVTLKPKH